MPLRNFQRTRTAKNITLNALGKLTGLSPSYLSALERGLKLNPSEDVKNKIAKALNVSTDRLTGDSASSIIDDKLKELDITLFDLAQRTNIPLSFLTGIDTVIPVASDYAALGVIAEELGLSSGILLTALARQEAPFPRSTPEEDFCVPYTEEAIVVNGSTVKSIDSNNLSSKEERDIARDLEKILSDMESDNALAFCGESPEDEEERELLKASLLYSMRLAKQMAKKKFTPKKYRKED